MNIHFLDVYVACLGLLFGSYLNVLVYRLPRRMSTVTPRSRCTRCRAAIRPWDNIPVLSYVFLLRGRCRHCGLRISPRYPAVELLTSGLFLASWYRAQQHAPDLFAAFVPALVSAAFCCFMVVLGLIDLEHFLLPDVVTYPGIAAGILVLPLVGWTTHGEALIGAAAGAGVLLLVTWGWYLWKGVEGMGYGDVKMLAMVGAWLGWQGMMTTLFVASMLGSAVGAGLMLTGRLTMKSRLPFGVFLAVGGLVALFFGKEMEIFFTRTSLHLFPQSFFPFSLL